MKVLVTGATGFIGGAVVRALVHRGIDVRVLARAGADLQNLQGLTVERVEGDLRDQASLRQSLAGCRQLYHVAAHYALWAKDPAIFYDVNVTGTKTLLEAARDVGTERIVYCSTIGAIGLPPGGGLGTEETPVSLEQMAGHYKRSKYLAEQEVFILAKAGLPVVIVNPSAPVGASDVKPTPTGQVIVDFMKGRMPAYIETGMNIVDVDDVSRLTGINAPSIKLPRLAILPLAYLNLWMANITGHPPRIPLEGVKMAKYNMHYDCSKAIRQLGYYITPFEKGIKLTIDHLKNTRYE